MKTTKIPTLLTVLFLMLLLLAAPLAPLHAATPAATQPKAKKSIRILFIGNSVSQDHVTYLPYLLKNTYGDDLDFHLYIFFTGGITLKGYEAKGDAVPWIFSETHNSERWTCYPDSVSFSQAFLKDSFDIVSIQGYYNYLLEDMSKVPALVERFKNWAQAPFELAWLMHQTFDDPKFDADHTKHPTTYAQRLSAIIDGAKQAIRENPVTLLFPPGLATLYAQKDSILTKAQLTPDGTHNHEGLPCIMGAYTLMEVIARRVGLPSRVIGNPLRMTEEKYKTLNIPDPQGAVDPTLTEEQWYRCQVAAIKAVNASQALFSESSKVMMNELYPR